MHKVERMIKDWRKGMVAAPLGRETIEELENHLRELVDKYMRAGLTELEAFRRAVVDVGSPPAIASEFRKLAPATWWPVKVAVAFGFVATITMLIFSVVLFNTGRWTLLLAAHVSTVTLGYGTTFLLGALGICFVCQRCFSDFSPARLESLSTVSFKFAAVAACLTAGGILTSMFWAEAQWGRVWSWDPKEMGGAGVLAWLIFFMAAQRSRRLSGRSVLLLGIAGNMVVSLGWFGANIVGSLQYGKQGYLLVGITTGLNLLFLVVGLAPAGWIRWTRV